MKKKILIISDHCFTSSGVANQTKFLIEGLLKKNKYKFVHLGAVVKLNESTRNIKVSEDFIIYPIEGFKNKNLIRSFMLKEKPDALIIFQDPRFFIDLFQIEDEIHEFCPILWWHVWDNYPIPKFNYWMYDVVDQINCHSYLTYEMCKVDYPEKTNYIPHSFPKSIFFKQNKKVIEENKKSLFEDRSNDYNFLWVNRNILRKRPGDLLRAWSLFTEMIKDNKLRSNLILHTDTTDKAGHNLEEICKMLNVDDSVIFSRNNLTFEELNILHNVSDCCINISFAEGFGLSTLQSLMTGKPIIAPKTGGQTRQVLNYNSNKENGVALEIDYKVLNGNQDIHYIYEDFSSVENIANAMFKMYSMSNEEKLKLEKECLKYSEEEYDYDKTVNLWDKSIEKAIENHKMRKNYKVLEI